MRSRWLGVALGLGLIAVVWGGWSTLEELRFRRELRAAEREMSAGLYRLARQRLTVLDKGRPGSTEAVYQLGLCEESLGQRHGGARGVVADPGDRPVGTQGRDQSCESVDEHGAVRPRGSGTADRSSWSRARIPARPAGAPVALPY